ncbi:MAG: Smr/MutS family protein [Candidatus Marinimicrobia bacterium]|nr:Smr/MutS family protein [Candidatus Neomarinimicrobiota bacterium]
MFDRVVQIAGIIDRAEAGMLLEAGADLLGFPLRLPVNKEDLSEAEAADIIREIPDSRRAVLITYLDRADEIISFCDELGTPTVQLHGPIAPKELRRLKRKRPDMNVIKSLVVRGDNRDQLFSDLEKLGPIVDAFITDTYDPVTGATGATGKTHDWSISRELTEQSPKPVILAGGLTPENVYEAILKVQPDGVDAHTGVESAEGRKDPGKVRRFIAEARRGFAALHQAAPLKIPINGVLDLHTFSPREVKNLVPEYLRVCRDKGIYSVRIIHGKGTGTLRKIVRSILEKSPLVASFETAGNWGATSVILRSGN